MDYIKLRKGLDIPIDGVPKPRIVKNIISDIVAVKPTDFKGLIPLMLVNEGDRLKAGSPVFADKQHPEIHISSPVSGVVKEIVRGEKRKILAVVIAADSETEYIKYDLPKVEALTFEQIIDTLLKSGLWACIKQRPYGIVPPVGVMPKAIFVSGFNSAPLAADYDYSLRDEMENLQVAVNVFKKILPQGINLGLCAHTHASTPFHKLNNVVFNIFDGHHPAGNVGVQIHHVNPISKGDTVWTIDIHLLAVIGRLFRKGIYDMSKIVAVGGPRVGNPGYVKCCGGMCMKDISDLLVTDNLKMHKECDVRCISGNVLTGSNVGLDGFLGFFDDQISIISEGSYRETLGWAKPFRPKKFSVSHAYFSWMTPRRKYAMDSNLNGGERAFVMNHLYSTVLPMDILPTYLVKAILAKDIELMEKLGIYEVIEEDMALCEYVCPSKIEIQSIISDGIDMMLKEMA